MTQIFSIHPESPQRRLLTQAVDILEQGGVIVYPTDTTYGFGCSMFNRKGVERILQIKRLPDSHQLSILCADLSDIARYARVDNRAYRILRRCLPGPYTFVLSASREVPKTLLPRRKTIGLRIPDHPICLALLQLSGGPLLSTTVRLPGEEILSDPEEIRQRVEGRVDLIIDGGPVPGIPSTVVDLTSGTPELIRVGAGDPLALGIEMEEE